MEQHKEHSDGEGNAVAIADRRSRRRLAVVISICIIVLLIVVGVIAALASPRASQQKTEVTQAAEVVTHSTDTPSEEKPGDDFQWKGTKDDPKKLKIESIGVDAYIQNVGVDQNDQMAVPNNVHIAGWFVDSVKPGKKGLSIIDGHLDGRRGEGVFDTLGTVKTGATIAVEFGSEEVRTFKVKDVKTVALNKAADILYSQDPSISQQLNLITCGGAYDAKKKVYDKRIIVVAERVAA